MYINVFFFVFRCANSTSYQVLMLIANATIIAVDRAEQFQWEHMKLAGKMPNYIQFWNDGNKKSVLWSVQIDKSMDIPWENIRRKCDFIVLLHQLL